MVGGDWGCWWPTRRHESPATAEKKNPQPCCLKRQKRSKQACMHACVQACATPETQGNIQRRHTWAKAARAASRRVRSPRAASARPWSAVSARSLSRRACSSSASSRVLLSSACSRRWFVAESPAYLPSRTHVRGEKTASAHFGHKNPRPAPHAGVLFGHAQVGQAVFDPVTGQRYGRVSVPPYPPTHTPPSIRGAGPHRAIRTLRFS